MHPSETSHFTQANLALDRLRAIRTFHYEATPLPGSMTAWNGSAAGLVQVREAPNGLHFEEKGTFTPAGGSPIQISNHYLWLSADERLRLFHLRHSSPVFLVELEEGSGGQWYSLAAHACGRDLYELTLEFAEHSVSARWHITGPKKNEQLDYRYSE